MNSTMATTTDLRRGTVRLRTIGRPVALVLAFLLPGVTAFAGADGEGEPSQVIRLTTDAATQVLQRRDISPEEKRKQIEDIVKRYFDFHTLARLTLARHWKALSPEQQEEFTREFERHLSITYGKNIESYNDERVVITGERKESGGDSTVKTRIARPQGEDILVDYRLRMGEGRWQVIDVIIEGVSLVANYRSQFQEIVSRQGVARLIDVLREKNSKGEPLKT